MKKVIRIIQKNFKLLLRSKASGLVVLLGPLLIVALLGFAFSKSSSFSLNVGVYSEEFNDLSNDVVNQMRDNQFIIVKYPEELLCESKLKEDAVQICIGFPPNFEPGTDNNNIDFLVDYSKINLAYVILDLIEGKVSSTTSGIRQNLTTSLLDKIVFIEEKTKDNRFLIENIKQNVEELDTLVNDINNNVKGMNLEFSSKEINLAEMVSRSKNAVEYGNSLESNAQSNFQSIKAATTENSTVYNLAQKGIDESDTRGETLRNESVKLRDIIASATSKITKLENDLRTAKTQRTSAETSVNLAIGVVNDLLETLVEVDSNSAAILDQISEITIRDPSRISEPITTTIKPVVKQETHLSTIFTTLLILIAMITAVLLSSTLVVTEKRSRAHFRNYLTPTSNFVFDLGTYFTSLIIVLAQIVLFLIVATYFFNVAGFANFGMTFLSIFLIVSLFILIGMVVGEVFRTEETNTLASITVASIFLFFSGIVLPIESASKFIQILAKANPFVIGELSLRQTLFFDYGFIQAGSQLLILLEYFIALFIFLILIQHFTRKRELVKLNKR